jgi:flavin reductase (DIM6/NTAB) family NADH-FMN oxidoreductase RutF
LFDNAQPESANIIGVVRAGTSEIFVAEIRHFAINESPKQHAQGNLLEKPQKSLSHFQEEESYEIAQKNI